MEKLKIEHRLCEPVTIGNVTIIPVEKVISSAGDMGGSFFMTAAMEPVAVIIITSGGIRAMDIEAREVSLQGISEMAPNLTDEINQLCADLI